MFSWMHREHFIIEIHEQKDGLFSLKNKKCHVHFPNLNLFEILEAIYQLEENLDITDILYISWLGDSGSLTFSLVYILANILNNSY